MGKPKYIESPEKLWELFEDYRKETQERKLQEQVFGGKDFEERKKNLRIPLTMEGFECYCMEHTKITFPDLTEYFEGQNESYKNYFPISARIKRIIRADQIEGGMTGQYKENITARINGLTDKKELDHKGHLNIPGLPDIGDR